MSEHVPGKSSPTTPFFVNSQLMTLTCELYNIGMVIPPSITNTCPVVKLDAGEAR
jgi:hypothetical protein